MMTPRNRSRTHAVKLAQLGVAVPQVMAHRMTRMALAGPVLNARDHKEFSGMVAEKQVALAQAWMGMAAAVVRMQQLWWMSMFTGRVPPMRRAVDAVAAAGLAPFHGKATRNAKRLAHTRLR